MSNFNLKVQALVGRGAQKTNATRFARNVDKAYRREIDRAAEVVERLEDEIADLESLEGVNLKSNTGLDTAAATSYVSNMVQARLKLDIARVHLRTAQNLYIEDFGKHVAPATSVEAVQEAVQEEIVVRKARASKK